MIGNFLWNKSVFPENSIKAQLGDWQLSNVDKLRNLITNTSRLELRNFSQSFGWLWHPTLKILADHFSTVN